jgi:hypothetical protein
VKRVHYGPVVRTNIEGNEVLFTVVLRTTSRRYVGLDFTGWVGKVARMRPSSGGLSCTEQLIHLRLLHEGYGRV